MSTTGKYLTENTLTEEICNDLLQNDYSSAPHDFYNYDCCKNCPNNPKNNPNAAGICHCALPSLNNVVY